MIIRSTLILALIAGGLTACQSTTSSRQAISALGGAALGGLAGSRFGQGDGKTAAIIAGAAIGGLLGSEFGRLLDERDRQLASNAERSALERTPSGTAVAWKNPDNGHYGEVVPGPAYNHNRRVCRNYTHTVYIDGTPQTLKGRACRRSDGTWQPV